VTAERWARKVVPAIAEDAGISTPSLVWRHSQSKGYTSGHCWYCHPARIVITQGNPRVPRWSGIDPDVDVRSVVLHEMAHAITRRGHDYRFYVVYWNLVRQYRLPVREVMKREPSRGPGRRARLDTGRQPAGVV
jgi:hypothetical protein